MFFDTPPVVIVAYLVHLLYYFDQLFTSRVTTAVNLNYLRAVTGHRPLLGPLERSRPKLVLVEALRIILSLAHLDIKCVAQST